MEARGDQGDSEGVERSRRFKSSAITNTTLRPSQAKLSSLFGNQFVYQIGCELYMLD